MYLGDTLEEKRESYELLTAKAKKLAKVFGVIGGIMGVILGLCLMFIKTDSRFTMIMVGLMCMVLAPVTYYWMGYLWFYGFVTVKSWFAKAGIGAADAAVTVGGSLAISYVLGGKKTVKVTGVMWLIALFITLGIGFYVGLYKFIKMRKEVKKLGII